MEDLSLLKEVIDSLEQDSNVLRIKRLILFTCHDTWSNDVNEVKAIHMRRLVGELMNQFPDLSVLKHKLNSHVKQLSKQSDYLLAADTLIDGMGFLYQMRSEGKLPDSLLNPVLPPPPLPAIANGKSIKGNGKVNIGDPRQRDKQDPPHTQESFNAHDEAGEMDNQATIPHRHNLKYLTNLFDLRTDISRNISPLHAKILLFSSLNYNFSPQEKDWSPLYTYDLDDLLQTIFQNYETFEGLESRLNQVSQTLDQPEDAKRAAAVILQVLKPFY